MATVRELPDLAATAALAAELAERARPGDILALSGDLGTGKTTFARAFIESLAQHFGTKREEVPSPTFTLVQTYEFPGLSVWHFDLYRLTNPKDALELGIEEAFSAAISLIEWAERLGPYLPPDRLDLEFEFIDANARRVRLTGQGKWCERLDRLVCHG